MSSLQSDESELTQRWEVVARQLYASGSSLYFPFFSCRCWITLSLTSPQNKKSLMLVHTPTVSYCQRSQTEKRQNINWGHA